MASLQEIREERLKKLEKIEAKGISPYPIHTDRDLSLAEIRKNFDDLEKEGNVLTLAGRIMSIRGQGAILFLTLDDGTAQFQGVLKKDEVGEEAKNFFDEVVDIGDFIALSGTLMKTKRGEPSVLVKEWRMLSKSLRPLPEKWHGLQDVEEKSRKRYLDTLMSEESKTRFVLRSKIISAVRAFLDHAGFLEVETSILQSLAGGATAKPFVTHHEALDIDLHLRVAVELFHKRLLIGGFPKIYEIGRNFRNEGIDATHNPEFTMLEYYEAYSDGAKQQDFVEALVRSVVENVFGKLQIEHDGETIDFAKDFERITFFDLLKKYAGIDDPDSLTPEEAKAHAARLGVELQKKESFEEVVDKIYKKVCRPKLIQPTFITDYPVAFSPFAKRKEDNPDFIDRFQFVVGGFEIVNAFSELNNPIDQKLRYEEQDRKRKEGSVEISPSDQDFLEAMEYGMPPAGGVGIGIDRLVMLLTDTQNIRDVILFPTLKPKG
ncbi:MAG TPA: lysine--tRNA ligase [Candidatus Paceibacterota bacterium]|nr:lysine--tRNA ligase [Candidatus Paceibacterota bacterium]